MIFLKLFAKQHETKKELKKKKVFLYWAIVPSKWKADVEFSDTLESRVVAEVERRSKFHALF